MAASATASSTSGVSVTQTGQPGPMMTARSRGKTARRPKRAMACSWLPQTCITFTGVRPIAFTSRSSACASARARAGSRNFSSAGRFWSAMSDLLPDLAASRHLAAHVLGHEVARRRLLQHLLEQGEGLADLVGRDAADGETDMVQHVVSDRHRLVDDVEPEQLRDSEEVDRRLEAVFFLNVAATTETHDVRSSVSSGEATRAHPRRRADRARFRHPRAGRGGAGIQKKKSKVPR